MRKTAILGWLGLLTIVPFVLASPVEPFDDERGFRSVELEPFTRTTFTLRCEAQLRTAAIVYGHGRSPLAVYVFDPHGNCVARDDFSPSRMTDDLAVEWRPPVEQAYEIEIRNLGHKQNVAEVAVR